MDISYVEAGANDFNPEMYIKILIAIAKADRFNGPPEIEYVRRQAEKVALDFVKYWNETDKNLSINRTGVSRLTAMVILKDCIFLASLDGKFSLAEKELVYSYAGKLGIPLSDVKKLEEWLEECKGLEAKWEDLVTGD